MKFRTVEWSHRVALAVHHAEKSILTLLATHFVLPDLPDVMTPHLQTQFHQATTAATSSCSTSSSPHRIRTIAACRHTAATFRETIQAVQASDTTRVDQWLVVGGNDKTSNSFSALQAIPKARSCLSEISEEVDSSCDIWAVADPNDPDSIEHVMRKLEAGATGIITQPLLSSQAYDTLQSYPNQGNISYIAGLALPKTLRGLELWLNLLEKPHLVQDDVMFRDHVKYFSSPHNNNADSSLAWARAQLAHLQSYVDQATIDGIHFMPMRNTKDLIALLADFEK
jgi:5,10-methylenetetrahydrofolate reductase